jgi:hypothetical protein
MITDLYAKVIRQPLATTTGEDHASIQYFSIVSSSITINLVNKLKFRGRAPAAPFLE